MRTRTIAASASRRWWTPLTAFMLTFGLAACDLPGVQSAKVSDRGLEAEIGAFDTASPVLSDASTTGRMAGFATTAEEPPASRLPPVEDMLLTPLENLGDPAGNALLTVRFLENATLPDVLPLEVDKDTFTFKRDASDKAVFHGMIRFDFDRFVSEQKDRQGLIAETRATGEAAFAAREFLGEEKFQFIDPQIIERARLTSSAFRIPRLALAMPASAVDPRRELMITDVSVVNDPTRTFDICNYTGYPICAL